MVAEESDGTAVQNAPAAQFLLLLLAALSVTMSYGATLPALPQLLQRLELVATADIARHTGWLTSAYTLALFAFSPVWGALSDVVDRRWIIAMGLAASAVALWGMEQATSIASLYALRILAGAVAAAVLPAVLAYVVETSAAADRQRLFAWVASATALGFLLGPVVAEQLRAWAGGPSGLHVVAMVCGAVAGLAIALPAAKPRPRDDSSASASAGADAEASILRSLLLTAGVVFGITVAEVGLTLTGRNVAPYFALCSALMVGVQLWAYPLLERRLGEHRLVALSFAVMTTGIALLALPASWGPGAAFVLAGAAIGVLLPALALRISAAAGERQGRAMGRHAAAANLGQAIAAAVTGALFAAAVQLPFLLATAVLAMAGFAAAKGKRSPLWK
jgi:MFS family permease